MSNLSYIFYFLSLCLAHNFEFASSDRTSLKIYQNIQSDKFCFRRLNATHQIGCSSSQGGNVGVIHLVENDEDIDWITVKGADYPYIAALTIPYYTTTIMKNLISSKRVVGIIVLNESKIPDRFSPDSACPLDKFGLYESTSDNYKEYASCSKISWNPINPALDMLYIDWNIPIFLVTNETDIKYIREDCFEAFNKPINGTSQPWPLCSAQLVSKMSAAKDTETCMRRNKFTSLNHVGYCDPLGDKNIILPLKPVNKSENLNNRSIVVVAARIDSFSMFDQLSPGAHSVIPGLVTLLTIAKSLGSFKEDIYNSKKYQNLIFMVFNGEAFDYIGSSRVVFDMEQGSFPFPYDSNVAEQPVHVKLEHISHFIEISQLIPREDVWIHTDPVNYEQTKKKIDDFISLLSNLSDNFIKRVNTKQPLPPSSLQRFLRKDSGIAGLVLADHEKEFSNKYYNSFFDSKETVNISQNLSSRMAKVAKAISRAIYTLFTDNDIPDLEIDENLISDILKCYIVNASCSIFQQLSGSPNNELPPYPLYVSVNIAGPNAITIFTHHLLANLTGDAIYNISKDECTSKSKYDSAELYQYFWVSNENTTDEYCIKTTSLLTEALSPAFLLKDWSSKEYSTWTESVWTETSARIFLQPSLSQELLTLGLGFLVLFMSFALVYVAEKKSPILFGIRQLNSC